MASPAYPPGNSASSASSAASSASASIVRPAAFTGTQTATSTLPRTTLIVGGARSGKSSHAERLIDGARAGNAGATPFYIATAEARDAEMVERIRLHRERRGSAWQTIEEPFDLIGVLRANPGRTVLVDCLTLWLTNLLLAERDLAAEREQLAASVASFSGTIILISNEVGLGIVPDNALARRFRDEAGILNQAIAKVCQRVIFMAAGLPMTMKDESAAVAAGAVR
jgi:adenosylcobinamide kinase / adenosylcobinamide-phosphate guanylyltransferase